MNLPVGSDEHTENDARQDHEDEQEKILALLLEAVSKHAGLFLQTCNYKALIV